MLQEEKEKGSVGCSFQWQSCDCCNVYAFKLALCIMCEGQTDFLKNQQQLYIPALGNPAQPGLPDMYVNVLMSLIHIFCIYFENTWAIHDQGRL